MKFVLEVELSKNVGSELGRILRYWGGSVVKMDLSAGSSQEIYDSEYRPVGKWTLSGAEPGKSSPGPAGDPLP